MKALAAASAAGLAAFSASAAAAGAGADPAWTAPGLGPLAAASAFAVEVDGRWVEVGAYPRRRVLRIGPAPGSACAETRIEASGLPDAPDLMASLTSCGPHASARLLLTAHNRADRPFRIGGFRPLDAPIALAGRGARVLSDSYSEDTPVLKIRDLDDGRGPHLGYGHQLIYDRAGRRGVLVGALAARRWLTYLTLARQPDGRARLVVEQAGVTRAALTKSLDRSRPDDVMAYQATLAPGASLAGEPLEIAAGPDADALLEAYGDDAGRENGARTAAPAPWGWWSWTAFYHGIDEGVADANALWLAQHLKAEGFDTLHLDEGVAYARGEYGTADAAKFPHGMAAVGATVTGLGLRLGLWTAPFFVSERSWVHQAHPEWLVRNARGAPILVGRQEGREALYVLDTTHPGAQAYLRQTYAHLVRDWRVGYLKLDFMDATAVEGVRHDPGLSALQAQRLGLQIIRQAVGDAVILDKDGSPMLSPVGIVDAGRISNDTEHSWQGTKDAASGIAARWFMNRRWFVDDPDVFCLSNHISPEPRWDESPTSLDEARAALTLSALAGGLFEIGDDLPALAAEPERLALLRQPDVLALARLGRAARPADLMTFDPADGQPSIFVLRESARQALVAVFNWTDGPRSHRLDLAQLGLEPGPWAAREAWTGAAPEVAGGVLDLADQPARSVRLVVLTRTDRPAAAPRITVLAPARAAAGETVRLAASSGADDPAVAYRWRFDDGIELDGPVARRAFTFAGRREATVTATGVDGARSQVRVAVEVTGAVKTTFSPDLARRAAD